MWVGRWWLARAPIDPPSPRGSLSLLCSLVQRAHCTCTMFWQSGGEGAQPFVLGSKPTASPLQFGVDSRGAAGNRRHLLAQPTNTDRQLLSHWQLLDGGGLFADSWRFGVTNQPTAGPPTVSLSCGVSAPSQCRGQGSF